LPVYSSQSRPGLFHPGSAHGVQPFRGFPSQEAVLLCQSAQCPPDVFSHRPPAAMASPAVGAPIARLEFASGPFLAFRASSSPRVRPLSMSAFTSIGRRSPLGLFASMWLSPCPRIERISPLLRSRAFSNQTFGVAPKSPARWRPSVFLLERGGIVSLETAWPLQGFTPPSFELL
jgi:hypothetical protein